MNVLLNVRVEAKQLLSSTDLHSSKSKCSWTNKLSLYETFSFLSLSLSSLKKLYFSNFYNFGVSCFLVLLSKSP